MIQPLNYTVKAIEQLSQYACVDLPASKAGLAYLMSKLRAAQVFVLPDHGELLDRTKPRPDLPALAFRPPFPVVALEYTANAPRRRHDVYTAARSSRRISLAWEWTDDLPPRTSGCASVCARSRRRGRFDLSQQRR